MKAHDGGMRRPLPPTRGKRKAECLRGHPFSGENLWVNNRGEQVCRYCTLDRQKAARARAAATRPPAPPRKRVDQAERFWPKVAPPHPITGCRDWMGSRHPIGYGYFHGDGRMVQAYRWAYEYCVGPIPEGMSLDHLCRNPSCVNPDHLEAVTHRENVLRGRSVAAKNARKTRCHRGHRFDYVNKRGERICKECKRLDTRAYRARAA